MIRVLIVDDEPLARDGLRLLLAADPDVAAIDEARSGRDAIARIEAARPNLVLLDVQMPGIDGFGVIDQIGADRMPAVVFVTAHDRYAVQAFELPVVGSHQRRRHRAHGAMLPRRGDGWWAPTADVAREVVLRGRRRDRSIYCG